MAEPLLMRGGLTNRVYLVTRYKDLGEGRVEAITKKDVTAQHQALVAPTTEAVEAVRKAIKNPGSHPAHHAKVMRAHREEWPTLWAALDKLLAVEP